MLKKQPAEKKIYIRFRRWSRKGYAVFAGLHKVISIGRVSAGISDKALLKSNAAATVSPLFFAGNDITNSEDEPEENTLQFEILLSGELSIAVPSSAGRVPQYYLLLTNGWNRT